MKAEWFVASADAYLGPYTWEQLQKLYADGSVAQQSMVHKAGEVGRPIASVLALGASAGPPAVPQPPPLPQRKPPAPQPEARRSVAPSHAETVRRPATGAARRPKPSKTFNAILMGVSIALGGVAAMFIARLVIPAFQPREPEPLEAVSPEPKRKAPVANAGSQSFSKTETSSHSTSASSMPVVDFGPSFAGDEPTLGAPSDSTNAPNSPPAAASPSGPRPQVGFSVAPSPAVSPSSTRPISPTFQ